MGGFGEAEDYISMTSIKETRSKSLTTNTITLRSGKCNIGTFAIFLVSDAKRLDPTSILMIIRKSSTLKKPAWLRRTFDEQI
jgi:hypothetical protein